jgi:hypothetical protein
MEEAKEEGLHKSESFRPKGIKVESEVADTLYLTDNEIKKIHDLKIDEDLVRNLLGKCKGEKREGREQSSGNIMRKVESMRLERDRFLIGYCNGIKDLRLFQDRDIKHSGALWQYGLKRRIKKSISQFIGCLRR